MEWFLADVLIRSQIFEMRIPVIIWHSVVALLNLSFFGVGLAVVITQSGSCTAVWNYSLGYTIYSLVLGFFTVWRLIRPCASKFKIATCIYHPILTVIFVIWGAWCYNQCSELTGSLEAYFLGSFWLTSVELILGCIYFAYRGLYYAREKYYQGQVCIRRPIIYEYLKQHDDEIASIV